jgi:NAD(P)-dependent dehydrogenase (short-subunit alcohol dehydrogenase family)
MPSFFYAAKRTGETHENMASVNGFLVEPMCAGYCAIKGAIIALTKAMANDHGRDGIRVNCICPGYIDTAF